ncbi:hypothetical protein ACFYZH_10045 [Streptomyces abikoensis]|uniref:hypothetical protein n=1 Tax=Streptomyces abikoensis TaxID=97398 RepID=UPI0036824AFE
MRIDPALVLHAFLTSVPDLRDVMVSGSMVGRTKGQASVILDCSGGYRDVRDRSDRAEITIHTYNRTQVEASRLAFTVREHLLEALPGRVVGGALVLDVAEVHMPFPLADETSGEFRYVHALALYLTEAF